MSKIHTVPNSQGTLSRAAFDKATLHLNLGCGPLHAWQVRVLFGMWEKHELMVFSPISSCFSHIPKRTRTCHACNGPHPKLMSRWEFCLIPRQAVSSPHHYECLSQRSTQVMRTSNNSMAGCIRCCDGWRLTILQDRSASGNASRSQPCISAKKPRHGLTITSKVSTIRDGCGPSRMW